MTVEEGWAVVVDSTKRGDWCGVLVGADMLSDAGEEAVAEGIRWVISRRWYPVIAESTGSKYDFRIQFSVYPLSWHKETGTWSDDEGVRCGWEWVTEIRQALIQRAKVLPFTSE